MADKPTRTPTPDESTLTIKFEDDLETATVDFPYWGVTEQVQIGFGPGGWPTAAEVNDSIADAVRKVLDRAYTEASGMEVER